MNHILFRSPFVLSSCALVLGFWCALAAAQAPRNSESSPPFATQQAASTGVLAGPPPPPVPESVPPQQIVRSGIDRLSGFLIGAGNPGPETLQRFLDQEIAPRFDFAYMSQWAAGPYARQLSAARQTALANRLRGLFLAALARNLGSFSRPLPRVDVYPARHLPGGREAIVPARVNFSGGPAVSVDFRFYQGPSGWKIFDVSANGASAVAYYRGYFTGLLRRHGPGMLDR